MRRTRKHNQITRKTICYVRCSTDEQATIGTSLDAQTLRIGQYAAAVGLQIDKTMSDPGWSAKTLQRPAMAELLNGIRTGTVEAVIVLKLDRITRSIADLQHLLALFDRYSVRLLSVCENLDTGSAAGRLVVNVLGTFAQFEREQTSERTALGLATKRRHGKAYGKVAFGFRRIGDSLVPEPREQAALANVRRMFDDGISYAKIAKWLTESGFKPPQGGTVWHSASVRKMCLSKAFVDGVGSVA